MTHASVFSCRSRWELVDVYPDVRRALGERFAHQHDARAMARGPHKVGGAEPRAERLST
jgi:hypothetical protein